MGVLQMVCLIYIQSALPGKNLSLCILGAVVAFKSILVHQNYILMH